MSMHASIITSGEAINQALSEAGLRDGRVLLFAEGIDDPSSVYGTTKDLASIYGPSRLIEMPIAENGLCGIAIGAAIAGKRPVVSMHRVEFALLALEQIINNAAKMHYMSNGVHHVPIVFRLIIGRGWGQGPAHSQSLESLFAYIPGLKVIMPVFPSDYKGMLLAAIDDPNPVVVIEHRWSHYVKGHVPAGYYCEDISRPKRLTQGADCTIVASSYSSIEALQAVKVLNKIGVTADLFDLRVARPLVLDEIVESVKKTGLILTLDIGYKTLGIGSEITSQITEKCWGYLKAAPVRIGLPDHPVPSSRGYLSDLYPNAQKIVSEVIALINPHKDNKLTINDLINELKQTIPLDVPNAGFHGPF